MRQRLRWLSALAFIPAFIAGSSAHALTWVEAAHLAHAGGSAYDLFAESVAIDGDIAVMGDIKPAYSPYVDERAGVAHVFVRSSGAWTEAAELLPSDSVAGDHFGISVAIRGDTIAVGSPTLNLGRDGRVYVFVRPVGGWSGTLNESARLDASSAGERAMLGTAVAFAGDSIVSTSDVVPNVLFVFDKPGSGWSGTVSPSAFPYCALNGALGSLAASGDVIVAGSPTESVGNLAQAGKAFVWVKPTGGWSGFISNAAYLLPSDPVEFGDFGTAVAIDGKTAVVGRSYAFTVPPIPPKGYVFEEPASGWAGTVTEHAQLIGSDVKNGSNFGTAASISGSTVVIGAVGAVFSSRTGEQPYGAAYIFDRPPSGWSGTISESDELIGPQGGSDQADEFGFAVGISGNAIVVGSPYENVNSNPAQGAAHVYERRPPYVTLTRFLVQGPIRVAPGVPVEFRVQVEIPKPASVEPTGVVIVGDSTGQECRAILDPFGEGSCTFTFPSVGTYPVRAHYLGSAQFSDSISPASPVLVGRNGGV